MNSTQIHTYLHNYFRTHYKCAWNSTADLQGHFAKHPVLWLHLFSPAGQKASLCKTKPTGDMRRKEVNVRETYVRTGRQPGSSKQVVPDLNDTKWLSNSSAGPAKLWSRHYFGFKQCFKGHVKRHRIFIWAPVFYALKILIKSQKLSIHFRIFISKSPSPSQWILKLFL